MGLVRTSDHLSALSNLVLHSVATFMAYGACLFPSFIDSTS
ncbi:hypothetical protein V3C99_001988 [Haemonchus contortus]